MADWSIIRENRRTNGRDFVLSCGPIVIWNQKHRRYACLTCLLPTPCAHTRFVKMIVDARETEADNRATPDADVALEEPSEGYETQAQPVAPIDPDGPYGDNPPLLWGEIPMIVSLPNGELRYGNEHEEDAYKKSHKQAGIKQRRRQDERAAIAERDFRDKQLASDAPAYTEDEE